MATMPAAKCLEGIVQEALQHTSEETAIRMMAAYRDGRTVCLMLTQSDLGESYQITSSWEILAPEEIAPSAQA